MSKSDENTNELDSYGVWVKNTPGNEQSQLDEQADNLGVDTGDAGLDLPDFDDTDTEFSDMFRDEPQFSVDEQEDDFGNDLDSTLSTDELANITGLGDVAIENVDAEPVVDDFESSEPVFEEEAVKTEESEAEEDFDSILDNLDKTETPDDEGSSSDEQEEEISLDDFMDEGFSDESVASGNNGYEPGAEKVSEPTGSGTEEIALDDFLDADSFDSITSDPKTEAVEDEPPIDMDITFDDSVDSVETEDNASLDTDIVYDTDDDFPEFSDNDNFVTEDESFEDVPEEKEEEKVEVEIPSEDDSNIDTEEIDLSDFGIDSDAEETPIVQDVEDEKNKEKVVDYDLFVESDSASSAPIVNEIKDEKVEEVEKIIEEPKNTTTVDNSLLQQIVADLSSLKNEINNIKSNIAEMKSREAAPATVEDTGTEKPAVPVADSNDNQQDQDDTIADVDISEESVTNEIPIPDVVTDEELIEDSDIISDFGDTDNTVAESEETAAFEMPEDDVTEENNILSDTTEEDTVAADFEEPEVADFNQEPVQEPEVQEDETVQENIVTDNETEPAISEDDTVSDDEFFADNEAIEDTEIPEDEGGFFSADDTDETIALSGDELSNIMNNADFGDSMDFDGITAEDNSDDDFSTEENEEVIHDETVADEDTSEKSIDTFDTEEQQAEEVTSPDTAAAALDNFNFDNNDSDFTIEETPFEENLDETSIEESIAENDFYDEMPDEIAIPKDDDIFVASTSSDFMDSVKDTTEEMTLDTEPLEDIGEVSDAEDLDVQEAEPLDISEDNSMAENTEPEVISDEVQDIPTVDMVLEDEVCNEDAEPDAETAATVEMETESTQEPENTEEESFSNVDFLNNGDLEDFGDDDTVVEEDTGSDDQEISFDDVDFLNTSEEAKVAAEEESAETDEPEITFDDVDFLNAGEPGIINDFDSDTESDETAEEDVTAEETVEESSIEEEPNETVAVENNVIPEEEEPEIEETSVDVAEVTADDSFKEVDNLDNNLSTSNIDYLTKEESDMPKDSAGVNGDLRQEIKSVLLYMDQLLESLPEDKIYEFAKSEEFATYKKLFKDLGLS